MASRPQIEANRRNAKRSTGPRSETGKSVVRANALKSGIYAHFESVLPTEDPTQFDALTAEYEAQYCPRTPAQRCLVDSLVRDEWLLRRFGRIEGEMMTRSCQDVEGRQAERFALANAYDENSAALERLQRRINAARKSYLKALEALQQLQADDPVQPIDEPAASPEIGFVPPNLENAPKPNPLGSQSWPMPPVFSRRPDAVASKGRLVNLLDTPH